MNSLATIRLFPAGQIVATPGRPISHRWNSSPGISAAIGAISARTTRLKTN